MATSPYPDYPPTLKADQFEYLLSNVKDWSILNGLAVRPSTNFVSSNIDPSRSLAITAPITLFPSLFPRGCFDEALALQTAYNELYMAIASDEAWLKSVVEDPISKFPNLPIAFCTPLVADSVDMRVLHRITEVDGFIAALWKIHLSVKNEGYTQSIDLGLFRSDYMVHIDSFNPILVSGIKQVEFNTIASSFGGLASKVSSLHRHLERIKAFPATKNSPITPESLPPNPSIELLSSGLAAAHKKYGEDFSEQKRPLCVLFIVQTLENNVFDQQALSNELWTTHDIPNFRLTFENILYHTSVSEHAARPLLYHPPNLPHIYEVTTCYFRAGYSPADYPNEDAWSARLHIERSAAIKCPSILTHLAGSKKIQQILATPSSPHLERFLARAKSIADPDSMASRIRATFAAIYPLDATSAGKHAISLATSSTESAGYVLKPQREGGGNNIYGTKIPAFLRGLGDDELKWKGHILMELIKPPSLRNYIFRNGEVSSGEVIGELGVYGACLWRKGKDGDVLQVIENFEAGHLLRTKGSESEEGGVAAGFGSVDSACLVNV